MIVREPEEHGQLGAPNGYIRMPVFLVAMVLQALLTFGLGMIEKGSIPESQQLHEAHKELKAEILAICADRMAVVRSELEHLEFRIHQLEITHAGKKLYNEGEERQEVRGQWEMLYRSASQGASSPTRTCDKIFPSEAGA